MQGVMQGCALGGGLCQRTTSKFIALKTHKGIAMVHVQSADEITLPGTAHMIPLSQLELCLPSVQMMISHMGLRRRAFEVKSLT